WDAVALAPLRDPWAAHDDDLSVVVLGRVAGRGVVVTGSSRRPEVRVWDVLTGEQVGEIRTGERHEPVSRLAVGRACDRGAVVVDTYGSGVRLWDPVTGEPLGDPLPGPRSVECLALGRAGGRDLVVLAGGHDDPSLHVRDAATGSPAGRLALPPGWVRAVRVGRLAGREVIAARADEVHLWDAVTGVAVSEPLAGPHDWTVVEGALESS